METSQRAERRPRLIIGAAILFAACAALWMTSPAGPPRALVALLDSNWQADFPFESADALEVRAPLSLGQPLTEIEHHLRAADRVGSLLVHDEGAERVFLLVAAPGVPRSRLEAVVTPGISTLAFLPVLDDGETAQAIRAFLGAVDGNPVTAQSEDALIAELETLRDECGPCRPKPGETLVIEDYDGRWSALVVSHQPPVFDQTNLRGAEVGVSAQDNRPTVYIYLTPAGRRAFQALTREVRRLALIVDGEVISSPRIMQEIDTERLELDVGNRYMTHDELLHRTSAVADALTPGIDLPPGVTWSVRTLPAAAGTARTLAFLLTLLLAGLLGAVLAKALAAFERRADIMSAPTPMEPTGGVDVSALVTRTIATLLALAAPLLVRQIPIPVLDLELLDDGPTEFSSLGVAGLTPLLLAHILVALIVWIVPSLSSLRSGSFDARRRLLLPTGLIAFALCTLQAVGMTPLYTEARLLEPNVLSSLLLALSLTAGTFILWGAAALATLAGFGNGFSLLIVGTVLNAVLDDPTMVADGRTQATVLLLGVLVTYATTRRLLLPQGARRLPLCGLTPLEVLVIIQALLFLASLLFADRFRMPRLGPWASLAIFVALTIGLSWLVAKPISTRPFVRALAPTLLLVVLVVQGAALVADLGPQVAPMNLGALLTLILFVPIALDVGHELLATVKHGRLSRVSSTHDPDEADRLVALLASRDIPAVHRGLRHRTLLRFLAPYVPIEVLVPLTERRAALAFLRTDAMDDVVAPFGEPTDYPTRPRPAVST